MSLQTAEVAHLLIALTLLVVVAHCMGHLFGRFRQPPVIGEILGGLLLGPTVLGALAPSVMAALLPSHGVTPVALGAIYQLGLLLLLFLAGTEISVQASPKERRTVGLVTVLGLAIPFAAGLGIVQILDHSDFSGPRGTPLTFALIFSIAIAVTSIPVISRILLDLGVMDTAFARKVLSVAMLEDIALYVVLAMTLGMVQARSSEAYGLWALVGSSSVAWSAVYYVVAGLLFFTVFLAFGGWIFRRLAHSPVNVLERRNPTAFRLVFLLVVVVSCVAIGINPIFGALMAGVSVSRGDAATSEADIGPVYRTDALKRFSLAFFIPVYFALVGFNLNLLRDFDLVMFCWFFAFACVTKSLSVWLGARLAGEDRRSSADLALAMNARGGPGIVLATVTLGAGLINEKFFTALVMLAILTSQIAGFWLDRRFGGRRHRTPAYDLRVPERQRAHLNQST